MFWIGLAMTLIGTFLMGLSRFNFQTSTTTKLGNLEKTNKDQVAEIAGLKKENKELHQKLSTEVIKSRFDFPETAKGLLEFIIEPTDSGFNELLRKLYGNEFIEKVNKSKSKLKVEDTNESKYNIIKREEFDNLKLFLDLKFYSTFSKGGQKLCGFHNSGPIEDRIIKINSTYTLTKDSESLRIYYQLNQKINVSKFLTGLDICNTDCENEIVFLIKERKVLREIKHIKINTFKLIVSGQSLKLKFHNNIDIDPNEHKYEVKFNYRTDKNCWNK